jgi:hypothetical protein
MKNIILLITSIVLLSSCIKYAEPQLLSLSGEYRFDKITYENRDDQSQNQVFYPGDLYVNPSETNPLDSIFVGFTEMSMDYSVIYFDPTNNPNGTTTWGKKFTYYIQGHHNINDLGYIVFDYEGTRRIWKIIDDGQESLVIRTSGSYDSGANSSGETTTMFLTRVGP